MLKCQRLDHFAIAAADTTAMVAWYERVLGLVVHAEAGPIAPQTQKVYLIGPPPPPLLTEKTNESSTRVMLGLRQGWMIEVMPRNDSPRHARNSHEPGLSHGAWCVADFDEGLAHLRACNVKFLGEIVQAVGGGRIISFQDCEGNMMQIVERKD